MRVLLTCPPMLGMKDRFIPIFLDKGIELYCPEVVQTLSEESLIDLIPKFDGWIIGDDPATRRVFEAGSSGRLRAAVKWGIGVDNVDFQACADLGIPVTNTPLMFGSEVADIAMSYVAALARETFVIDREIRSGGWPKPRGISLANKTMCVVGYGDIGRNVARRALAADMKVVAYDPAMPEVQQNDELNCLRWPEGLEYADFIVFTCSLNKGNIHMLNESAIQATKRGVRVVNVARGPLIDEEALIRGLESGQVYSAALDVYEVEPLPMSSALRSMPQCIFGSHNASNTEDAVIRASECAMEKMFGFLGVA